MKQRLGQKIQFGEVIQLKHMYTGKYLSIEPSELAGEHGFVKVKLDYRTNLS